MLFQSDDRMLELLWFVGYCVDFPAQLADRIDGHWEWNRHVKYRAIKSGYLSVHRDVYQQRVIRSLRLTPAGLEYIGQRDPKAQVHIMARQDLNVGNRNATDRITPISPQAVIGFAGLAGKV